MVDTNGPCRRHQRHQRLALCIRYPFTISRNNNDCLTRHNRSNWTYGCGRFNRMYGERCWETVAQTFRPDTLDSRAYGVRWDGEGGLRQQHMRLRYS
jgi:hypothetical protein